MFETYELAALAEMSALELDAKCVKGKKFLLSHFRAIHPSERHDVTAIGRHLRIAHLSVKALRNGEVDEALQQNPELLEVAQELLETAQAMVRNGTPKKEARMN